MFVDIHLPSSLTPFRNNNNNNNPLRSGHRVVVEGLSICQDSHLTGKQGAGQGSPSRPHALFRAILVNIIALSRARAYTTVAVSPRSSTLRLCAFSGQETHAIPRGLACVAAGACFGRDALGRPGSESAIQRGADVGGVVVAVAAAGERGSVSLWTSSCDPSAPSSAVLLDSSGVVPLPQFIVRVDSLRDGVLLVLSSVVNRDRYHSFLPSGLGFGCCSTLTRASMCLETRFGCSMEACGRISHISHVFLALFAWNLNVFS